jgi:hypothetical protein
MAFGGAAVFAAVQSAGRGNLVTSMTGATLTANAGPYDPTGVAADSGQITSNGGAIDPVAPATATSLPAAYGPGPDNWSQEDVDALIVHLNDTVDSSVVWNVLLVANVNPAPAGSNITNNNVVIGLHNTNAVAAAGLSAKIQSLYSTSK